MVRLPLPLAWWTSGRAWRSWEVAQGLGQNQGEDGDEVESAEDEQGCVGCQVGSGDTAEEVAEGESCDVKRAAGPGDQGAVVGWDEALLGGAQDGVERAVCACGEATGGRCRADSASGTQERGAKASDRK